MQAPGTLSPQQRSALESAYTFFAGVAPFLEATESRLPPDEQFLSRDFRDLAGVCEHKLVEAFPELLEWLRELERGGAS
jgi:hypothetical protein